MIKRLSGLARRVLRRGGCIGLVLGLGLAGGAQAATYTEVGNATRFFNNGIVAPQDVGPGIDQIRGVISGGDQGDLFKLEFDVGGTLRVFGTGLTGPLMPAMFLFDATGAGLVADAGVNIAAMEAVIVPGIYYLGFGDVPLHAIDTDGTVWDSTSAASSPPPADFGTLDRLDQVGTIVGSGNYRLNLSIATAGTPLDVPEPAMLGILGLGLAGLAAMRRRGF